MNVTERNSKGDQPQSAPLCPIHGNPSQTKQTKAALRPSRQGTGPSPATLKSPLICLDSCTVQRLQIGKLPVFCPPLSNSFHRENGHLPVLTADRFSAYLAKSCTIQAIQASSIDTLSHPLKVEGGCVSSVVPSSTPSERIQAKRPLLVSI